MFRYFFFFIILFICPISFSAFLPATEDIPLMDGIILTENEDFSFDTPAGQILTLEGTLKISPSSVRIFYDETLQSLGWEKQESDSYVRGQDTLQLSFPAQDKIRFDILLSN